MTNAKLLCTTALICAAGALAPAAVKAQTMHPIDIPAQPLGDAIKELGSETSLKIAASAAAVAGKTSTAVSGPMTATAALDRLLEGTGLSLRPVTDDSAIVAEEFVSQDANTPGHLGTLLLNVFGIGTTLGTGDPVDSGSTLIGRGGIDARAGGSGDANDALLALPTVQHRSDTSGGRVAGDVGSNGDSELDLKPTEFSVSGASVLENQILVDGVSVRSVTGNVSPTKPTNSLDRQDKLTFYVHHDLHSQTQYVPTSMVEGVEVIDSNVSAEHGDFQGGVVRYELIKPQSKSSGGISFSYQDESFVKYRLGTEDGDNPGAVRKPDWHKSNFSIHQTGALGAHGSFLLGYSRQAASARKQREPQFIDRDIRSNSTSDFYRLGYTHDFGASGRLTTLVNVTQYTREWDARTTTSSMDVENSGVMLTSKYENDLGSRELFGAGASDLRFEMSATVNRNKSRNLQDENDLHNWITRYDGNSRYDPYTTDHFDAWCDGDLAPASDFSVNCTTGGTGDSAYDQKEYDLQAKLSGNIWGGEFTLGADYSSSDINRSAEGFTFYSVATRLTNGETFTCAPGDGSCTPTQAFTRRTRQDAYNVDISAYQANAFLNFQKEWERFEFRGGLRFSYNSVLKNVDIAPRLTAVWNASERLAITVGANRYYSGNYLAYAVHDGTPRGYNESRDFDASGNMTEDWHGSGLHSSYQYSQAGLRTPFNDELTLSFAYEDPFTNGQWRLRATHRMGKDQFARSESSTTNNNILTNAGRSEWTGVSLEYQNEWEDDDIGALDKVGLTVSGAWAQRQMSNDTYFGRTGESGIENFIWYEGKSYTENDFGVVTGDMDIPVKFSAEVTSSWKNGRYKVGLGADFTLGYTAAIDSGDNETHDNPDYGSQNHDVYEDRDFKAVMTLNMSAAAQIADLGDKPIFLEAKVSNLLDKRGNGFASDNNPWVKGRSVWIGTSVQW